MSTSEEMHPPAISVEEDPDQTIVSLHNASSGMQLGVSGASDSGESSSISNATSKSDINISNKSGNSSLSKSQDSSNVSKEKPKKKVPATRVVQSRFKTAAAAAKNNSGNSSNSRNGSNNSNSRNGSNSSNNSNSRNELNATILGGPTTGRKVVSKPRPVRASIAPAASGPISRSTVNVMKTGILPNQTRPNKASPRTQVSQSATNLASQGSGMNRILKPQARPSKPKLHSTILNATVQADMTQKDGSSNVFSTTLVGGMAQEGRNLDMTGVTLPELPDISAIRLDSAGSDRSGDATVLSSVSEKDSTQESNDGNLHEVTAEELELEYLRYLQWAQVNLSSKDAFCKQLSEAQTQIIFLEQLIAEKQTELSERMQKIELVHHHQQVVEANKKQTELLQNLIGAIPASEEGLQTMSRELEKSLHQVKMDNLYIPENHKKYRDQLSDALSAQVSLLSELESLLEPRSNQLQSTINLLEDLQNTTRRVQQCENEINKGARLSVQDASLQIGAQQANTAASASHLEDTVLV